MANLVALATIEAVCWQLGFDLCQQGADFGSNWPLESGFGADDVTSLKDSFVFILLDLGPLITSNQTLPSSKY